MRILIVEDDKKIASFISKGLKESGYAVDHAADGENAVQFIEKHPYDALIVDLLLPVMDGYSFIKKVRDRKMNTPVLILSAKGTIDDKLKGFESGTDDYLTKPFSFAELLARIQALIRRSTQGGQNMVLKTGDLMMNLVTREVSRDGRKIDMQPREYELLLYLLRNAGNVVTKTMIMEHI